MNIYTIFILLLLTILQACTHSTPKVTLVISDQAPVNATYLTQAKFDEHQSTTQWQLHRTQNRIEVYLPEHQTGEIWLKDTKQFFYQKVFHQDKKMVEYSSDDFRLFSKKNSHLPHWQDQAYLVDPEILKQLSIKKTLKIHQHDILVLTGEIHNIRYQVQWNNSLGIPLKLVKRDKTGHFEKTELVSLNPEKPIPDSTHYEIIDYADLGDRERDMFVLRIQNQLPGGDLHHH